MSAVQRRCAFDFPTEQHHFFNGGLDCRDDAGGVHGAGFFLSGFAVDEYDLEFIHFAFSFHPGDGLRRRPKSIKSGFFRCAAEDLRAVLHADIRHC